MFEHMEDFSKEVSEWAVHHYKYSVIEEFKLQLTAPLDTTITRVTKSHNCSALELDYTLNTLIKIKYPTHYDNDGHHDVTILLSYIHTYLCELFGLALQCTSGHDLDMIKYK